MAGERSRLTVLKELKVVEAAIVELQAKGAKITKKQSADLKEKELSQLKLQAESAKLLEDNLKTFAATEKSIGQISNSYRDFKNQQKETNDLAKSLGDEITPTQAKAISEVLSLSRDLSELNIEDAIQSEAKQKEIDNQIDNLQTKLKLNDKVLASLKKQNIEAGNIAKSTKDEKKALNASTKANEQLKEKTQALADNAKTAAKQFFNIFGFLGFTLIGLGKVLGKLAETNREIGNVGGGFGNLSAEVSLLSLYFDNANEGIKSLAQEFGDIQSYDVLADTLLISKNMGVSATDAARLQQNFAGLNGGSKDIASNMIKTTQQFANQNNLIPSQLMADLAANTEQFALFGKDGGKNILAAAGYAAKLGVSMSKISGIADNLLDFESSITKELELSAMLGKSINLSKARELAYAGDLKGATQETLRQLGGISAFNQMDYYQKKQTADLLGVTVEEFKKMATNQGKANSLGSVGVSQFDAMSEGMATIANSWIPKAALGLGGILSLMALANKRTGLLGRMFGGIGNAIGIAKDKLLNFVSPKTMGPMTKMGKPDMRFKANKQGSGGLKSLAEGLKAMGNPKVLFGALNLIPTALGFVAMIAAIPGMLGIALLGKIAGVGLSALGLSLSAFGATVSAAAVPILIGLGILALLGSALIPLAYALSLTTPVISAFGDVLKGAFEGIASMIPPITDGFLQIMGAITLEKVGQLALFSLAIVGLAGSMYLLGTSLAFLGATGLPGLLMLAGIAALSVPIIKLASLLGIGGESSEETTAIEKGGESLEQKMLTELTAMKDLLKRGNVIKLNGQVVGKTIFSNEDNNQMQTSTIG